MALSFAGAVQTVHFDRAGFKVTGKRMFASYLAKDNTANIFLTPAEQAVFCEMDSTNIFPLPNKWGLHGFTTFVLNHLDKAIVLEALLSAYSEVMKKK